MDALFSSSLQRRERGCSRKQQLLLLRFSTSGGDGFIANDKPIVADGVFRTRTRTELMLMGDGARLMSARSRLSVDGQTTQNDLPPTRGPLQIPTGAADEFVNERNSSKHVQLHVDNSASEHEKNDITSKTAAEHGPPPPCTSRTRDHANEERMSHQSEDDSDHTSDKSAVPESVPPPIPVPASTGVQHQLPFSAETVQASIRGAVAAVASVGSAQVHDSSNGEARKMSVGDHNVIGNKKRRNKRKPQIKPGQSSGRWTVNEHRAFLEGLRECGREWKKVALRIPTRTSAQIRSHAQKYFSKLQRDHESIVNQGDASNATAVPAGTEVRPSALRSVDRMLANPHEAQREVENTLEALRERYRQLQLRLEQRQHLRANGNRGDLVEDDASASTNPRKRALEEPESNDHHSMDDQSSVSSAVSASVASISSGRGLGNEELIALHVLGGDLARGDASIDDCSQTAPAERKSPEPSDNSSEGDSHGSRTNKRHRKEA